MDRLSEIQVPTLILHGQRDRLAPLWLAEEIHRGIKGSQMLIFPGGHVFFIFRPRQFVNALLEFWSALKLSEDKAQGASL
jgi:pimeloyl-ACP methyl ester carboxylesterase